jgi:hypothetical protein
MNSDLSEPQITRLSVAGCFLDSDPLSRCQLLTPFFPIDETDAVAVLSQFPAARSRTIAHGIPAR